MRREEGELSDLRAGPHHMAMLTSFITTASRVVKKWISAAPFLPIVPSTMPNTKQKTMMPEHSCRIGLIYTATTTTTTRKDDDDHHEHRRQRRRQ